MAPRVTASLLAHSILLLWSLQSQASDVVGDLLLERTVRDDVCDTLEGMFQENDCSFDSEDRRCKEIIQRMAKRYCIEEGATVSPTHLCDTLRERWGAFNCDEDDSSERCQNIQRRMELKGCGAEEDKNVATPAPQGYCTGMNPGRFCTEPEECTGRLEGRELNLICGDSPASYVCCQTPTDAPHCSEGSESGKQFACVDRSECSGSLSGSIASTYRCGDGPELCCKYPAPN